MSYICHCTPERTCELCEAMLADMPVAPEVVAVPVDRFGTEYNARSISRDIAARCEGYPEEAWEVAASMVADIAVAMVVMGKRGDFPMATGADTLATVSDLAEMYYRESLRNLAEYTDL